LLRYVYDLSSSASQKHARRNTLLFYVMGVSFPHADAVLVHVEQRLDQLLEPLSEELQSSEPWRRISFSWSKSHADGLLRSLRESDAPQHSWLRIQMKQLTEMKPKWRTLADQVFYDVDPHEDTKQVTRSVRPYYFQTSFAPLLHDTLAAAINLIRSAHANVHRLRKENAISIQNQHQILVNSYHTFYDIIQHLGNAMSLYLQEVDAANGVFRRNESSYSILNSLCDMCASVAKTYSVPFPRLRDEDFAAWFVVGKVKLDAVTVQSAPVGPSAQGSSSAGHGAAKAGKLLPLRREEMEDWQQTVFALFPSEDEEQLRTQALGNLQAFVDAEEDSFACFKALLDWPSSFAGAVHPEGLVVATLPSSPTGEGILVGTSKPLACTGCAILAHARNGLDAAMPVVGGNEWQACALPEGLESGVRKAAIKELEGLLKRTLVSKDFQLAVPDEEEEEEEEEEDVDEQDEEEV